MTGGANTTTWSARRQVALGLFALALLVGGFGTWTVTTSISGAVIAPGAIEVEQNRQVVQHPDGGVVASIAVREGDAVAAGDILIRLDPALLKSEQTIVEGQLFEIMARSARLEAERDGADAVQFDAELGALAETRADVRALMEGQEQLFAARRGTLASEISQLEKRIGQIRSQIEGISAQQAALEQQLALVREELEQQRSLLEKGLTQASRVLALQRDEAGIQGTLGELTAARAESEGRITEIEIEILKLPAQRREEAITELRDIQFRALELAENRRALSERLDRLDIRAPVAGIVLGMQVFAERAVVQAAEPVLFLVPQDRPLLIAAQVDTVDIDEVFVGQIVVLRFAAFDARTTPELFGQVMKLSADAFTDETSGRSYYRAEIRLAEGEAEKLPEGLALVPGMPVEAFIRTADRSPLAYLIKPLADYFKKAFRES
jgi:HlyD family secretion protein